MTLRSTLFAIVAAFLYFGPFLGGLSGGTTALMPIFVGIYVIWLAAMRPRIWAEATAQGTPLALAVYLVGMTLTQVLAIIAAFGIGRGLSSMSGALNLPLWLPVAITLAAVPLSRLIGNPETARPTA